MYYKREQKCQLLVSKLHEFVACQSGISRVHIDQIQVVRNQYGLTSFMHFDPLINSLSV